MRRRRLAAVLVGALALAALAGACGLPNESSPNEIAADQLPEELFVAKAQTTTTVAPNTLTETLPIYLVQQSEAGSTLRAVNAQVQVPEDEDRVAAVITRLVNSPPLPDDDSLTSAIPQGTMVLSVRRNGDVIEVNLNRLVDVTSTLQRLAVAQIVFTAMDVAPPDVSGVRFFIDGSPAAVPVDQETRDAGAVIRKSDFPSLDPSVTTTTTAPPPPASEVVPPEPAAPAPPG